METIPTGNAEVGGNKGRQISQYCLGIPTILRQILKHFSTKELIELSLMNKLWNFEARSVLRERGNLIANPLENGSTDEDSCQNLVVFASDLEKMRVVPFTGLSIPMFHGGDCCKSASNGPLHPAYNVILDRLPWKHFSVRFYDCWDECKGCPELLLVNKILEDYGGELEELSLHLVNDEYLRTIFINRNLPCLKTLTVTKKDSFFDDEQLTNAIIKSLVAGAPNLQELRVQGEFKFRENVLKGNSAALVTFGGFRPLVHQVCESLIGSYKAEWMEILLQEDGIDLDLLNTFIPRLLQGSRTSLKFLRMDLLFAVPLMCYGICLENVTTLQILMNHSSLEEIEPSILELTTGLDFTRVFPKVIQVMILDNYDELAFSSDEISAFVEQGTEALGRALPDRAINIKLLDLRHCSEMEDSTLQLLGRMFPHVTAVYRGEYPGRHSFHRLQAVFPMLEETLTETHNGRAFWFRNDFCK